MLDRTTRTKYFLFNTTEEANRFYELYESDGAFGIWVNDDFYLKYFGEKVRDKYIIAMRMSTNGIEELVKILGLKKRRYNGKLIYVFT